MRIAIHSGTIVTVQHNGGFAFVRSDEPLGDADEHEFFAHRRAISAAVRRHIRPGLRVMFNALRSARRPGQIEAVDVQLPVG
jgi:cold shock CspA family protein